MKYALVFGGGGGKGAYEIGVWKALNELGYSGLFSCVIGTSVGALNGAFFAQSQYEKAEQMWREIDQWTICPIVPSANALSDQSGIEKILRRSLGKFNDSVAAYVCSVAITDASIPIISESYHPNYFFLNDKTTEQAISCLLSSAALPGVYPSRKVLGQEYRDGGLLPFHNVPYMKAIDMGFDRVLAVSLSNSVVFEESHGAAKVLILCPTVPLAYPQNTKIRGISDFVNGTIDFNPKHAEWRKNVGYRDVTMVYNELYLRRFFD